LENTHAEKKDNSFDKATNQPAATGEIFFTTVVEFPALYWVIRVADPDSSPSPHPKKSNSS